PQLLTVGAHSQQRARIRIEKHDFLALIHDYEVRMDHLASVEEGERLAAGAVSANVVSAVERLHRLDHTFDTSPLQTGELPVPIIGCAADEHEIGMATVWIDR